MDIKELSPEDMMESMENCEGCKLEVSAGLGLHMKCPYKKCPVRSEILRAIKAERAARKTAEGYIGMDAQGDYFVGVRQASRGILAAMDNAAKVGDTTKQIGNPDNNTPNTAPVK
jgi:hypothetical protein